MRTAGWALGALVLVALSARARAGEGIDDLRDMEDAVTRLVKKVSASVVGVENPSRRLANLFSALPGGKVPKKGTPAWAKFVEDLEKRQRLLDAWGSAFAVDERHVLTTARVMPPAIKKTRVILPDGSFRSAEVTGRSEEDNAVLLEVEDGGLTPLPLAGREPAVGDFVLTVGNAFEVMTRMGRQAYSLGVVSARTELEEGFCTHYQGPVLETDAAVNPGVYGGPLVNRRGEVVGMITSSFAYRRWLGCAVPLSRIRRALAVIRGEPLPETAAPEKGPLSLETLGVIVKPGDADGWAVSAVEADGVAARLGWRTGDRLVSVDGAPLTRETAGRLFAPGRRITVVVDKGGWRVTFIFTLPQDEPEEAF